ncbi:MAG: efflux RND transporter periplasmic adaptor subunit [Butyrivibrio sp.]
MLKKVGFYICIGCILILCTYSIYLMYQIDANYKVSLEKDDIFFENSDDEIHVVGLDNVTKSISVEGRVVPVYEDERTEVCIEGKPSDIEIYVNKGSVLDKGFVYALYNGKEYKADSKMHCIGINQDDNGVVFEFIDYSKLYIELCIPEKYALESLCGKNVELIHDGSSFSGEISYIDGYCTDGVVRGEVKYKNQEILLRPGTKCNANIIISQKENVVVVPLEFIMYSEFEDEYRVMIVDGDKTINRTIKVGIIGDSMVEIISGISENECIMMPKDEMSLKYYLNNSQGETK